MTPADPASQQNKTLTVIGSLFCPSKEPRCPLKSLVRFTPITFPFCNLIGLPHLVLDRRNTERQPFCAGLSVAVDVAVNSESRLNSGERRTAVMIISTHLLV